MKKFFRHLVDDRSIIFEKKWFILLFSASVTNISEVVPLIHLQVWQLYEEDHPLDIADPKLTEFDSVELLRAIRIALLCIQSSPRQRPSMSRVVSMLTGDSEAPEAVSKPSYVAEWQSNTEGTSSSVSTAEAVSVAPFLNPVVDDGRWWWPSLRSAYVKHSSHRFEKVPII
jgi:hypothetical protein